MRASIQDVGYAQEWGQVPVEGQLSLTRGTLVLELEPSPHVEGFQ